MQLLILSDLHIEFEKFELPDHQADVIVLAGDISVGKKGLEWANDKFPHKPVVYVLGNHEHYGHALPKHTQQLQDQAAGTNIHILENGDVTINGISFLGCTLWTDFELFGNSQLGRLDASENMNDYRKIRISPSYRKLNPADTLAFHKKSVHWLENEFEIHNGQKFVVVSHHAPSSRSIPEGLKNDSLNVAFASNLDMLVEKSRATLWIHGHIHTSNDYTIGQTRVICNPKGYPDETNLGFSSNYVLEI